MLQNNQALKSKIDHLMEHERGLKGIKSAPESSLTKLALSTSRFPCRQTHPMNGTPFAEFGIGILLEV